jgi:trehalose 6-phosphate phosphatase
MSVSRSNVPALAENFFFRLQRAAERVLILDYDGTLAPFRENPAEAEPYPGVRERLDAIMDHAHTRVILVSGRWTKDLLPLLQLRRLPEIWGSHGWEQLRANGEYALAPISKGALKGLVEADEWTDQIKALGGWCEHKPGSLAIHWRGLQSRQIASIQRTVYEKWMALDLHKDLVWYDFDGGIELRAPGRDKGYVVNSILSQVHDAAAAYLGDDNTDEDAFKAIKGRGLSVLVRPTHRPTAADLWLRPPIELLDFLGRWHITCDETKHELV